MARRGDSSGPKWVAGASLLALLAASCVSLRIDIHTPVTVQDDCDSVDARTGPDVPGDDGTITKYGD